MIYFPTRSDCPNRAKLATMSVAEAATWAARASTHCMEVSRLAEVETFYNLTRAEAAAAHAAAVTALVEARVSA
ncbi:hypothetical protein NL532_00020 [Mesorhizobium sp. C120A]|uniref:hypothetical protein n=1 Tax=unclassified Mesorhizobium TaxID=325217 RepID=UPI0003CFEE4F|nr:MULTISPECIES: hypothetical protein [unclassified Mesorhizobium]ESZ63768.1 hypothetical protein X728_09105 [Mesorhizobium sp. L103C120A0]WJI45087.1 hypothetical protein NL532_00020 [Mesorhizobium sp. C120A]